jgi:hypothetical protein
MQSRLMSAIETAAGTAGSIILAQAILWWNEVPVSHALAWNLEILAVTALYRYGLRRLFARAQ